MAGKVDVIGSAAEVTATRTEGRSVAVIDVFRATSVMCTALANGAKRIIPVTDIDGCHRIQSLIINQSPNERTLLGGERMTYKIEGFDLDNSPLAYTAEKVNNTTVIMSTTNGTRTINAAVDATEIYIASMLNANAVTEKLRESACDISIICSGRHNLFTMEDGLCAGLMAHKLAEHGYLLSDYAWTMADMYRRYKDHMEEALIHCKHYNNIKIRLADDIAYCLKQNILTITPKVYDNEISGYQEILISD